MENEKYEQAFEQTVDFLRGDITTIRTDRAHPSLVENINVVVYDTNTPIIQLASITVPEARVLVIQPWDKNTIKDIEKSLQKADLGTNPVVDGEIIRLVLPMMTQERRDEIVRMVQEKLENAKVSLKRQREEFIKKLKVEQKDGTISEDEYFKREKDLQKAVDVCREKLQEITDKKSEELKTI